jgi:hypothetical protein
LTLLGYMSAPWALPLFVAVAPMTDCDPASLASDRCGPAGNPHPPSSSHRPPHPLDTRSESFPLAPAFFFLSISSGRTSALFNPLSPRRRHLLPPAAPRRVPYVPPFEAMASRPAFSDQEETNPSISPGLCAVRLRVGYVPRPWR